MVGKLFSPSLWLWGCLSGSKEQKEEARDTGLPAKTGGRLAKHSPFWNLRMAWGSLMVAWLHKATTASAKYLELKVTSLAFG